MPSHTSPSAPPSHSAEIQQPAMPALLPNRHIRTFIEDAAQTVDAFAPRICVALSPSPAPACNCPCTRRRAQTSTSARLCVSCVLLPPCTVQLPEQHSTSASRCPQYPLASMLMPRPPQKGMGQRFAQQLRSSHGSACCTAFVCPAVVRAHRCHVCCAQIPQSRSVALGRAHSARGPLACSSSRHARCGTTRCKGADAYEHSASLTAAKHTQVPRTRRRRTQSPRRTARRRGRTTT